MGRIIYDYTTTHIVGKSRSGAIRARIVVTVLALCILAGVVYALFFSPKEVTTEEREVFLLSLGSGKTEADALILAQKVIEVGGGGYIGEDNRVYASVYANKTEADGVASRIGEAFECEVIRIVMPGIICTDATNPNEFKVYAEMIPITVWDKLYSTFIALDTGDLSDSGARYSLTLIRDAIVDASAKGDDFISLLNGRVCAAIYRDVLSAFDSAITGETGAPLTSRIKHLLLKITFIYINNIVAV